MHGLFLKHHISRVFNRQDAKYAKFPRRCLSAGANIELVGLGDLGVLAVGQIVKLQAKIMGRDAPMRFLTLPARNIIGNLCRRIPDRLVLFKVCNSNGCAAACTGETQMMRLTPRLSAALILCLPLTVFAAGMATTSQDPRRPAPKDGYQVEVLALSLIHI